MRNLWLHLILIVVLMLGHTVLHAQRLPKGATMIILVRHAEKADGSKDAELSKEGMERATRLPAVFPGIHPGKFYSTPYKRTTSTLVPWAKSLNREVLIYDPLRPDDLLKKLRREKNKTIVVAGHSNTIPQLVNKLVGSTRYASLPDGEYGKIFVVTIQNKKISEKIITY